MHQGPRGGGKWHLLGTVVGSSWSSHRLALGSHSSVGPQGEPLSLLPAGPARPGSQVEALCCSSPHPHCSPGWGPHLQLPVKGQGACPGPGVEESTASSRVQPLTGLPGLSQHRAWASWMGLELAALPPLWAACQKPALPQPGQALAGGHVPHGRSQAGPLHCVVPPSLWEVDWNRLLCGFFCLC